MPLGKFFMIRMIDKKRFTAREIGLDAFMAKSDDQYSDKDAQRRFEAALKGARIAGHKPMSEVSPKTKADSVKAKQRKPKKSK